jgi:hypothetical protein
LFALDVGAAGGIVPDENDRQLRGPVPARNERLDFPFHFVAQLIRECKTVDDRRFDRFSSAHPAAFFPDLAPLDFLLLEALSEEDFLSDLSADLSPLLDSLFDDEEDDSADPPSSADFFPPLLPYPSAYQPPPFKMKLEGESKRLAFRLLHSGQVLIGSSVIRCSRSNSKPHFWH